ncbi:hypothetical protein MRX96_046015 [Rhipicephalus microplus]
MVSLFRVARTRPTGARSGPRWIPRRNQRRRGPASRRGRGEDRREEAGNRTHRDHCHRTRTRATRLLDGGSWTAWGGPTLGDTTSVSEECHEHLREPRHRRHRSVSLSMSHSQRTPKKRFSTNPHLGALHGGSVAATFVDDVAARGATWKQ